MKTHYVPTSASALKALSAIYDAEEIEMLSDADVSMLLGKAGVEHTSIDHFSHMLDQHIDRTEKKLLIDLENQVEEENSMYELIDNVASPAKICVVGIGGGGCNAVRHMVSNEIQGVKFISANTDAQALSDVTQNTILQFGSHLTKGLGAGANPEIGRQSAIEDRDRIVEEIKGVDLLFITAGMGGGTGTGGAPVFAKIARELGILTVAVVTKPFTFEGRSRRQIAEDGIRELKEHVDSLISIPNEKLLSVLGSDITLLNAFNTANDVLLGAVRGIADLVIQPGMINVDFADVRTVMSEMGLAVMGTGVSHGKCRAREATEAAIQSPLLEGFSLQGARGILVNITAGVDLSLGEFAEVGDVVKSFSSDSAVIVVGTVIDPSMEGNIKVTVVATGLDYSDEASLKVVHNSSLDSYGRLDVPTVMRKAPKASTVQDSNLPNSSDFKFLDIPTFLRRQVD